MELGDGLVFYMTPPDYEAEGYPSSGLYRNGILIYSVIGYTRGDIFFSQDRMSFLYFPHGWTEAAVQLRSAADSYTMIVLFFEEGEFSHGITQRGVRWAVEGAIGDGSDFGRFSAQDRRVYDLEQDTLRVTTRRGFLGFGNARELDITFDLSSGEIISVRRTPLIRRVLQSPLLMIASAFILVVCAALVIAVLQMVRSKRRQRELEKTYEEWWLKTQQNGNPPV